MGSSAFSILILVLLFAVMYFLMIRPQKKREKETQKMRSGVQVGDEIVTIGGICAKVVKTKEESLVVQVGADKVKMEIMRWAVSKVVKEGAGHKAADEDNDAEEAVERKSKPRRMKKAAPVAEEAAEEKPAEEPAVEEATEEAVPATEEETPATEEESTAEEKTEE